MNACKRVVKIEYHCTSERFETCDFESRAYGYCDWNNNGICKNPKAQKDAAMRAIMEEDDE